MFKNISELEWNYKNGNVTKEDYTKKLEMYKGIAEQFTDTFETYTINKLLKEVQG